MEHDQAISFETTISRMMFGFGDSHTPNRETVRLVESIVLKQLRTIVKEALKHASVENTLQGYELVFLMRHNTTKMQRFVKYLYNKQTKMKVHALQKSTIDVDLDEKPKCALLRFIEHIDETGEFTDLSDVDEGKFQRQLRADMISQALDETKYRDFCKARRVSFKGLDINKDTEKLRLWVDPTICFEHDALDVLAYYAYETVAELTDYALIARMDAKAGDDPLKHIAGSYYNSAMFNGDHRFSENKNISEVYSGQPPISVYDIKEVMRRLQSGVGKLNFGGPVPDTHQLLAL